MSPELATYQVQSTSRQSANVQDIPLDPEKGADAHTRRILRPTIVENTDNEQASVRATIMHQRRHSLAEPWQDADSFNLATLKGGQEIRLELSSSQTLGLYQELKRIYAVAGEGIPYGERNVLVLDNENGLFGDEQALTIIRSQMEQYGHEQYFELLAQLEPDLFAVVALKKTHENRCRVVETFRQQLGDDLWSEHDWEEFFKANTWVFGYGLAYQFLGTIQVQPHYGGNTLDGKGAQRGDFLMRSEADCRFTVLVDIKKPKSQLVGNTPYRNKVYGLGHDLVGGVCQLQSNCRTWATDGSQQGENRHALDQQNIYTYEPKGILVVGHTREIADDDHKRASFELFRRNLHNPEILTYDELLARAEFIISNDT